jgi:hypothetical protein
MRADLDLMKGGYLIKDLKEKTQGILRRADQPA